MGAQGVVKCDNPHPHAKVGATWQHGTRRALGDEHAGLAVAVIDDHGGHHLALRGERNFCLPCEPLFAFVGELQLARCHQEGRFCRVAQDLPRATSGLSQLRVARHTAATQNHGLFIAQRAGQQRLAGVFQMAFGRIPHTRDVRAAGRREHPLNGHLIARQGAGLVRRDNRCRAQRLDRGQPLHDGLLLGHALHPQRQHHRQDGGQPLGHRRHGQRHAQQQHRDHILGALQVRQQQDRAHHHQRYHHHHQAQLAPRAGHFLLQWRGLGHGGVKQVGDATHLGGHAGGGDHGAPAALCHGRALEDHVQAFAQGGRLGQCRRVLQHRFALAGE